MKKKVLIIKNKTGIHARPASLLVQAATNFKSEIYIEKEFERVDCKSIMSVMMLAIGYGNKISIFAEGEDEKKAIDTLSELIEGKFKESPKEGI